jgi:hypothetical protein
MLMSRPVIEYKSNKNEKIKVLKRTIIYIYIVQLGIKDSMVYRGNKFVHHTVARKKWDKIEKIEVEHEFV